MTARTTIVSDPEHSLPKGNLNKMLSALKNRGFQKGKESHCSEILGPQMGGAGSLNLFQPLIETQGGRGGGCLHTSPGSRVLISAGSGFYLGFVSPFGGGEAGRQQAGISHSCTASELCSPTFLPVPSLGGQTRPPPTAP